MAHARFAIVDYGAGNIGSLLAALGRRGVDVVLAEEPEVLAQAQAVILPGDGAFGSTMTALAERGLDAAIRTHVTQGKPFLGICVGMQVLFEHSDEYGGHTGLGILPGNVRRFVDAPRVPHMGWNTLTLERAHPFVAGVASGDFAYFLHSYRIVDSVDVVASAEYGERFAAIVARGNVMATQFHPEKSARTGARLLENFLARVA
jgi:glutamine amidotransferase